jgi:hypothetical protein
MLVRVYLPSPQEICIDNTPYQRAFYPFGQIITTAHTKGFLNNVLKKETSSP